MFGANYELAMGESNTIGATYLGLTSDSLPNRDGMSVYNLRAYLSPFKRLAGLSLGAEYANEDNGSALSSTAWMAQAAYELGSVDWKPKVSYRYAYFKGDDPSTEKSEAFDPLFLGFSDWGTWWQGEIAGEYFLSNSNLISHTVRLHFTPTESLGTGFLGFVFQNDQPASFGPNVTSKNIASELDGTPTGSSTATSPRASCWRTGTRRKRWRRGTAEPATSPTGCCISPMRIDRLRGRTRHD